MSFTRDAVANVKTFHFLTNPNHFTNVFVADNHGYRNGFLRPLIPVVDMNVSW